ncbi:hypothetical protein JTE90_018352 [Oedothorax gibbosus]|uniref:C2H2-type domain-containing protein n=1 Tax=Oedothorax gibbosus TaxID=931172 RepID=A0AAV6U0I6_9ARAC|nr:hypothetical protein JTE90_018352 [Oedothorax gibbosus]
MEEEPEYKTVLYVTSAEEEVSTSYIIDDKEYSTQEGVIVVNEDGTIVIDDNTTYLDEEGNPIILNRRIAQEENVESTVVMKEIDAADVTETISLNDSRAIETISLSDPQAIETISLSDSRAIETISLSDSRAIETISSNDSQGKSSADNDSPETGEEKRQEKMAIFEHDVVEAGENKNKEKNLFKFGSDSKLVSILKPKQPTSSNEIIAACKSLTMGELSEGGSLALGPIDKLTCSICSKRFTKVCNKLRHMRIIHNVTKSARTLIKCIECNVDFSHLQKLRNHLQGEHQMKMDQQELSFPNMGAFKKWKIQLERNELSSYVLRHSKKKTTKGDKYFFMCHRAGKYVDHSKGPTRKRMIRKSGTCKLGIMCTAAIYCEECPDQVYVSYCPYHYGHGKETAFVQITEPEQNAIQENISNGVSCDKILKDMREDTSSHHFQTELIKRRDMKFIKSAFDSDEYSSRLSDAESVHRWVRLCCQMEESPVLYYRQEANSYVTDEEFVLIIMTEFQKNILLSSDRQILCVDAAHRRKGGRFYLTTLIALDESETAFPVAFCISNQVNKKVVKLFLTNIRDSTGPISCTYFMSESDTFYHEAWLEVMADDSKWLWSIWYVDTKFRVQLKAFKNDMAKRADCYRTMRLLLECQNKDVFDTMFKNFLDTLSQDATSKNTGSFIAQKYGTCKELWAYSYHRDIKLGSIIQLEALHRTMKFCCMEGRKNRLDKFIFVIMKLVRFKMLDRLTRILDDEKISLALDAISMFHGIGIEIDNDRISSSSEKIWLVRSDDEETEEDAYVVREFETCPDHCTLKCEQCGICVHMFSCSCMQSMMNANLCQHIHAVVWKFLSPQYSPEPSPPRNDDYEEVPPPNDYEEVPPPNDYEEVPPPNYYEEIPSQNDNYEEIAPQNTDYEEIEVDNEMDDEPSEAQIEPDPNFFFQTVLDKSQEVFNKIRGSKDLLSNTALNDILSRLNECVDICSGKAVTPMVIKQEPNDFAQNSANQVAFLPNVLPHNPLSQYVMILPNDIKLGNLVQY